MKKFVLASVSALALLGVAACSEQSTDTGTTQAVPQTEPAPAPAEPATPPATEPAPAQPAQ